MMKTTRLIAILAAGLLCLAADDKTPAKKKSAAPAASSMPMPKPGPEMKELS